MSRYIYLLVSVILLHLSLSKAFNAARIEDDCIKGNCVQSTSEEKILSEVLSLLISDIEEVSVDFDKELSSFQNQSRPKFPICYYNCYSYLTFNTRLILFESDASPPLYI